MKGVLAGLAGYAGSDDGNATEARFWNPQGLAADNAGNVYVADTGNNTVRKITPAGMVTTLPQLLRGGDTNDAAGSIQLNSPGGVAVDGTGNIYVADSNNHCIRKITPTK